MIHIHEMHLVLEVNQGMLNDLSAISKTFDKIKIPHKEQNKQDEPHSTVGAAA